MASTFRNILTASWILFGSFSTIAQGVHCISLEDSRRLHQDAVELRLTQALLDSTQSKIIVLEQEKQANWDAFNAMLSIEKEKARLSGELSDHYEQVLKVREQELNWYKKRERRAKWQRNGAVILAIVLVVLSVR